MYADLGWLGARGFAEPDISTIAVSKSSANSRPSAVSNAAARDALGLLALTNLAST